MASHEEEEIISNSRRGPHGMINRLREQVRSFWAEDEEKFKAAWRVLDKSGKTTFAQAVVAATSQMTPQADLLVPELNVEDIVDDPQHVSRLFWYYFNDEGFKYDKKLVADLELSGALKHPADQAVLIRQLAILSCLDRLIDVYQGIFHKAAERVAGPGAVIKKRPLVAPDPTICDNCKKPARSSCGRCQKVGYCSADCQRAHWKVHKTLCADLVAQDAPPAADEPAKEKPKVNDKDSELKERLKDARRRAQEKQFLKPQPRFK